VVDRGVDRMYVVGAVVCADVVGAGVGVASTYDSIYAVAIIADVAATGIDVAGDTQGGGSVRVAV